MVKDAAELLQRDIQADVDKWLLPEGSDPYIQRVAGQSAAIGYGLIPPADEVDRRNYRRDPVYRAPFLDPWMPMAQWQKARQIPKGIDDGSRWYALHLLTELRPDSPARLADEAAALQATGRLKDSLQVWNEVVNRAPGDLRFVIPRARAALLGGKARQAVATLEALPPHHRAAAHVARLRVEIADAAEDLEDYDELLRAWMVADVAEPEPVRRLVHRRIAEADWKGAMPLVDELAKRGAVDEANTLRVALGTNLGRWDLASRAARHLGDTTLAARIDARASIDKPAEVERALERVKGDRSAILARAQAKLEARDYVFAHDLVDVVLRREPWWPAALEVKAAALAGMGEEEEAAELRAYLLRADPDRKTL